MRLSPILLLHICTGTIGCLAGAFAVSVRKGSRLHGLAGTVFVVSMLSLAASGVYLALLKHQPGNIFGGALTFYLVTTAWMTARHSDGKTGLLDWGALLFALAIGTVTVTSGLEAANSPTGLKYGYPVGVYVFLSSVAILAAAGDIRMFVLGGVSGTHRVARHLWRMCFAWFIASASIFLARAHIFPAFMRRTGILHLLSVAPLLLMIFWLVRVRLTKLYNRVPPCSLPVTRTVSP
jgi:hypothetical protein